ncbi:PAC2 family protein [Jatrophihabitans telluris]|uniref:PAC2 family protein n=1 Tax=Jatrophihabitans telluris TaxID=2038343 RepID=A0ABY4QZD1_9ACTN|nr:PAC2 family protein [Jatrophihabitans telluris]UQX88275.1 PAC2 family protein [Jatrophihabitans telluris]
MLDPQDLFQITPNLPPLDNPVLVQALEGFSDAGHAARLAREHLLDSLESEVAVTFDVDQLFDYRARRPAMIFATDHWESYEQPVLAIHLVTDGRGTRFLVLTGPEPDVQWERFTRAVQLIVAELGVRRVIGLNAIPMGVPHTRPSSVIAHGSPRELVADYNAWLGTVQVPASAGHLLEFRVAQSGIESMGFAVNVPHYVAQLEYPDAAVTLIECIARAGDLDLPLEALAEAAQSVRTGIDEQVAGSEEVAQVVRALEQQYDSIVAGRTGGLIADGATLPTADEIGAEFERFLARQDPPDTGDWTNPTNNPTNPDAR